jgi:hypothetical protein
MAMEPMERLRSDKFELVVGDYKNIIIYKVLADANSYLGLTL